MARAIAASGSERALIGDCRVLEGGNVAPPGLLVANGNQANQWKGFEKVKAKPPSFGHLEDKLKEDAEAQFGQPDGEELELSIWSALPVHQKVATLFMPGLDM